MDGDGVLSPGETWSYTSATEAAQDLSYEVTQHTTFYLTGNSYTTGSYGNTRTFTRDGVEVEVSAFSRNNYGTWQDAYLGAYGGGLGVTNRGESGSSHRMDNQGWDEYIVFQFDNEVVIDDVFLDYVGYDSDISYWVGNRAGDIDNLSDSLLSSFTEESNFTGSSYDRWADINNSELSGDTFIISAYTYGSNDSFKVRKLGLESTLEVNTGDYVNIASVDTGLATDTDFSGYTNPVV